ncbi:Metallo-hydrolase/oxidoreductase [Cylindrobasidium torrendii FP15055 ss-10]|uniref:Metallo-hydrolase/oxidoreductase n=1 Tax=Cylindrobasidium torrendii FP15055 ss-10 TaxID=1314674 RepID=A0A0D7B4C5_9AGAR|nr:Metallo-hydrolase/oxidoreductase [Cylindrobasidium torrendii FP15055 ss-10]
MSTLSHHVNGGFRNPWGTQYPWKKAITTVLKVPLTWAKPFDIKVSAPKTVSADFSVYNDHNTKAIKATWLGHAGFVVQVPGCDEHPDPVTVLFDPIFAERASPVTWLGPKRWLLPPCRPKELPVVDYIFISHNHYDHLDIEALRHICLVSTVLLVPLGIKQLILESIPIVSADRVHEMDWWDSKTFPNGVEVVCTPAQHNSGRGVHDQGRALWASWVARRANTNIYHAGDTGYTNSDGACPAFAEIGAKYGPFDLAMIPIWRGASLSFLGRCGLRLTPQATETLLATLHATPRDAVALSVDIRAKHSIAMHFGTFCGSEDEAVEPVYLLKQALESTFSNTTLDTTWAEDRGFRAIDVGETVIIT